MNLNISIIMKLQSPQLCSAILEFMQTKEPCHQQYKRDKGRIIVCHYVINEKQE